MLEQAARSRQTWLCWGMSENPNRPGEHAILWGSLRDQCDCFIVVRGAESVSRRLLLPLWWRWWAGQNQPEAAALYILSRAVLGYAFEPAEGHSS